MFAGVVSDQDEAQRPVAQLFGQAPRLRPLLICRHLNSSDLDACCAASLLTSIAASFSPTLSPRFL